MNSFPQDAFEFSEEANEVLNKVDEYHVEAFYAAMEQILNILLNVYDGRSHHALSIDSWGQVQQFICGRGGSAILFQTDNLEIELRRRPYEGFRIAFVRYAQPTIH